MFGCFFFFAKKHSAAGSSYDFVSVKGKCAEFSESSAFFSFIYRAKGFSRVLNEHRSVLIAYAHNFIKLCRISVKVNRHHGLRLFVSLKSFTQSIRIHVPCFVFGIYKNRICSQIFNRICRSGKSKALAENFITGLHSRKNHCHVQCGRSGRKRYRIFCAGKFCYCFFKFSYILSKRSNPILFKSVIYVFQFITFIRHMRT